MQRPQNVIPESPVTEPTTQTLHMLPRIFRMSILRMSVQPIFLLHLQDEYLCKATDTDLLLMEDSYLRVFLLDLTLHILRSLRILHRWLFLGHL